ncbi:MAG TPA: hypothetical protein VFA44_08870 [Gaiellaceae bacterium]|nr:hypothetical protein [Gaiellaceae bacterium]
MSARALAPPTPVAVHARGRPVAIAAGVAAFAGLVALRLHAMHPGLLYPDGYQYLLMAKGIGQHLQPVAALGPHGDVLAPSPDAAAKPLFPALVALGQALGLSPLGAARLVSALASAAVAPLAGLVALRLGAPRAGALLAVGLALTSPTLSFWSGFPGPDALAQALALGAGLALLGRRPARAGALAGLAVATRPELLAVAAAAAVAAACSRRLRREATIASASGLVVVALVLFVLRPPLAGSTLRLVGAALVLAAAAGPLLALAERASGRAAAGAGIALAALVAGALAQGGAWLTLGRRDWALLAACAAGLALAVRVPRTRPAALRLAGAALVVALVYWWKNPHADRYVAELVPALAILAGLGLGTLGRTRAPALAAAAAAAAAATLVASLPSVGRDQLAAVAASLERAPAGAIVTAAPDAYGVLLPERSLRAMRPGASGLVLVDGAARAYEPDLTVRGALVATIRTDAAFLAPDGTVDRRPAYLYRGTVVRRR